jgi:hypothetical protein
MTTAASFFLAIYAVYFQKGFEMVPHVLKAKDLVAQ